ncbi:Uncharacterised protein [Mycobacterium tuberculosis]|nr:Uncharacterised protein [Mycobacterium tuberculosis]
MDPGELQMVREVVRPKTPRGDGNFSDHLCGISGLRSSDPKPREGTETPMRRHFRLQFQPVVRPKTPRGDGNQVSNGGGNLAATGRSSDPKPREGTETCANPFGVMRMVGSGRQTQNPERGRKPHGPGRAADGPGGRQTQNPERGRKHGISAARPGRCCPRSSDPKPREGTETSSTIIAIPSPHVSSDPKPREGTETCANPFGVMRMVGSGRQTQNPERGRKP